MLKLVKTQESWGIYGPSINDPTLLNSPEEALSPMVRNPEMWPGDIDFWLALCDGDGGRWDALGFDHEDYVRPLFSTARQLRSPLLQREFTVVDFWFLARFVEALKDSGYRYVVVRDGLEANVSCVTSGRMLDINASQLRIRRKHDWKKNFLLVRDEEVLRFMNVRSVNKPSHRRGFYLRISHLQNPS